MNLSYWSLLWCCCPLVLLALFGWTLCRISAMCDREIEQRECERSRE